MGFRLLVACSQTGFRSSATQARANTVCLSLTLKLCQTDTLVTSGVWVKPPSIQKHNNGSAAGLYMFVARANTEYQMLTEKRNWITYRGNFNEGNNYKTILKTSRPWRELYYIPKIKVDKLVPLSLALIVKTSDYPNSTESFRNSWYDVNTGIHLSTGKTAPWRQCLGFHTLSEKTDKDQYQTVCVNLFLLLTGTSGNFSHFSLVFTKLHELCFEKWE